MINRAHPVKGVLAERRITNRAIARRLGRSEHYVGRAFNGHVEPSEDLKIAVAALLGLPVDELFHPARTNARVRYPGDAALGGGGDAA